LDPRRSFSARYVARASSSMSRLPSWSGERYATERARSRSGAPFTKQRTMSVPSSARIRWNVAISRYAASKGSVASRG
jgi:hypothetical protein